jgi:hypothetical protein
MSARKRCDRRARKVTAQQREDRKTNIEWQMRIKEACRVQILPAHVKLSTEGMRDITPKKAITAHDGK